MFEWIVIINQGFFQSKIHILGVICSALNEWNIQHKLPFLTFSIATRTTMYTVMFDLFAVQCELHTVLQINQTVVTAYL